MNTLSRWTAALVIAASASLPQPAMAQAASTFPSRPVRIVVPTPAAGPSDTTARLVAQALTTAWGQQVIVENRAGAGGALAAQAVMAAPADGHTLLWALSSMAGLPFVQASPPYRSMSELTPVTNAVQFSYGLFVSGELPIKSFAELVAYGRANPGKLNYATGTLADYMLGARVLQSAGIEAVRVPYKGAAQLMPDLISGQVQINFGPIISGLQHVKTGKLKLLATLLPQRSALLPEVPTLTELGVPASHLPAWNGVFAPANTPRDVVEKISLAIAQALKNPATRSTLEQQGAHVLGSTPAQLAEAVEAASGAWQAFARDYKLPLE